MFSKLVALVAAFVVLASCGQSVTLPKDKAEFAKTEIEKIAREYSPLADEAFADESAELQTQRAALRARLYAILEVTLRDIKVSDTSGLWDVLARAAVLLMGVAR